MALVGQLLHHVFEGCVLRLNNTPTELAPARSAFGWIWVAFGSIGVACGRTWAGRKLRDGRGQGPHGPS